jgi:hypothetical protein
MKIKVDNDKDTKRPTNLKVSQLRGYAVVNKTSGICLEPSVTNYQTFTQTTYKVMGMTGKKPSREKVKKSVQLLLG